MQCSQWRPARPVVLATAVAVMALAADVSAAGAAPTAPEYATALNAVAGGISPRHFAASSDRPILMAEAKNNTEGAEKAHPAARDNGGSANNRNDAKGRHGEGKGVSGAQLEEEELRAAPEQRKQLLRRARELEQERARRNEEQILRQGDVIKRSVDRAIEQHNLKSPPEKESNN